MPLSKRLGVKKGGDSESEHLNEKEEENGVRRGERGV